MVENVLVSQFSVTSESEKICSIKGCEVEKEGGGEGDDEE